MQEPPKHHDLTLTLVLQPNQVGTLASLERKSPKLGPWFHSTLTIGAMEWSSGLDLCIELGTCLAGVQRSNRRRVVRLKQVVVKCCECHPKGLGLCVL